jgi:hypothetical protein
MKYRVKNTPFWGVMVGTAGSVDHPQVELLMKDGSIQIFDPSELTTLTIKEVWDNRANKVFGCDYKPLHLLIYSLTVLALGFTLSFLLL